MSGDNSVLNNKSVLSYGGRNAYSFECAPLDMIANYGTCLITLELFELGLLRAAPDCKAKMEEGVCPAMRMKEEELAAGKRLYWEDRPSSEEYQRKIASFIKPYVGEVNMKKLIESFLERTEELRKDIKLPRLTGGISPSGPKRERREDPRPEPAPVEEFTINDGGYAEAINQAIAKGATSTPVAPKPADAQPVEALASPPSAEARVSGRPNPKPAPAGGMTLLERARLMRQQKVGQ